MAGMKFTILGSKGFIGRNLKLFLEQQNVEVTSPARNVMDLRGKQLGHVVYAIGLTGNFRERPQDTINAHVNVLQQLLDGASFDSWLYLSSTRVYSGLTGPAAEKDLLNIRPSLDSVYDLSKLLGESICMGLENPTVRVARLSNVYGAKQDESTFLGSVLREIAQTGAARLREAPESSKDYISVDDTVRLIHSIATLGQERIYNVASGVSLTHGDLASAINSLGYQVTFLPDAPTRRYPSIDISRITTEFGYNARLLTDDIPMLVKGMQLLNKETINEQIRR
jgi:nucleoside-diphosphate-sugar epimerase